MRPVLMIAALTVRPKTILGWYDRASDAPDDERHLPDVH